MQGPLLLLGIAERPLAEADAVAKQVLQFPDHALDVYHRVAGEDLGQPLGEVAGQAAVGALMKAQVHGQGVAFEIAIGQLDVVGAFAGVAEEGVEEIVAALPGEYFCQVFRGEKGLEGSPKSSSY